MALYSRTKPKYIFHPQTSCRYPTAAILLSQVQELTVTTANYHKKCERQQASANWRTQRKEVYLLYNIKQALCIQYDSNQNNVQSFGNNVLSPSWANFWASLSMLYSQCLTSQTQTSVCTWGTAFRLTPRNMQFQRQKYLLRSMPSFTNCDLLGFLLSLMTTTLLRW